MTARSDTMPTGLWVHLMHDENTAAPYQPQELFRCRRCAGLKPITWRAPVASVVTGVRVTDVTQPSRPIYLTLGGARALTRTDSLTLTGMPDPHRDCTCAKEPTP